MHTLELHPGPRLVYMPLCQPDPGPYDVTEESISHLFDLIWIAPSAKLSDLLGLFETSPELLAVYRRRFAMELMEEVRKGPLDGVGDLELLELFFQDNLAWLRAFGPILEDGAPDLRRKAGERIEYGVSLTPVRKLLSLPLRVAADCQMTLGEAILGALNELTFYGGPAEQAQIAAKEIEYFKQLKDQEAIDYRVVVERLKNKHKK